MQPAMTSDSFAFASANGSRPISNLALKPTVVSLASATAGKAPTMTLADRCRPATFAAPAGALQTGLAGYPNSSISLTRPLSNPTSLHHVSGANKPVSTSHAIARPTGAGGAKPDATWAARGVASAKTAATEPPRVAPTGASGAKPEASRVARGVASAKSAATEPSRVAVAKPTRKVEGGTCTALGLRPADGPEPCGNGSKHALRSMPAQPPAPIVGSKGLDVCFVMDCTASMGPWIEAAKATLKDMIRDLPSEEPNKRVAFVAYRDLADGPAQCRSFTQDVDSVTQFIDSQSPMGGDDIPEDMAGALAVALGLDWRAETRTLVLVSDAPCHGSKYHNETDMFPQGDPTGLSMVALMRALRTAHIDFTFVQLCDGTHKMQDMLRTAYETAAGPENIRKFELRDLRGIIQAAGGAHGEATYAMLTAAVSPTLCMSYASTSAGRTMYSANTADSYQGYLSKSNPSPAPLTTPLPPPHAHDAASLPHTTALTAPPAIMA